MDRAMCVTVAAATLALMLTMAPSASSADMPMSKKKVEKPLTGQTLHCPSGLAISNVWWMEINKQGAKKFAITCENVTVDGCAQQCSWEEACSFGKYGHNRFVRSLQIKNDKAGKLEKAKFLCCKSIPRDGFPEMNSTSCAPHRKKHYARVDPAQAEKAGLGGLSNMTGFFVLEQEDLTSSSGGTKKVSLSMPCKQFECTSAEEDQAYEAFKDKFPGKNVPVADDVLLQQFRDNLDVVYKLKTECVLSSSDASFSLTKFMDLSLDQMVQFMGGALSETGALPYTPPPIIPKRPPPPIWNVLWSQPKSFNWLDRKVVPAVRDQKSCGACYAFSVSDLIAMQTNIEKHLTVASGVNNSYAAQYIVDCFQPPQALGCKGGRPASLIRYLAECGDKCALPLEKCYPYNDKENECDMKKCTGVKTGKVKYSSFLSVVGPTEKETMAALIRWGGVLTTIAISPALQMYGGQGVVRVYHCGNKTNHAVTIVGYDYTGPVPYYVVRNSWGADWGNMGYVKIEAGVNACGIAQSVLVACVQNNCEQIKNPEYVMTHPNG